MSIKHSIMECAIENSIIAIGSCVYTVSHVYIRNKFLSKIS